MYKLIIENLALLYSNTALLYARATQKRDSMDRERSRDVLL